LRIEAYGTVDELNAVLGLVRSAAVTSFLQYKLPTEIDSLLATVQHTLFDLGSQLATPDPKSRGTNFVTNLQTETLEQAIDRFEAQLPPLKNFILPGGTPAAAWLHLARTVCRRAERHVVTLTHREQETVLPEALIYLNRLSDLLFVLARAANQAAGQADVPWEKPD
jgi:cob(I)alamin adenosyltransferase